MASATSYKNGDDIEFNYQPQPNDLSIVNEDTGPHDGAAKKKKKKKKKKTKSAASDPIPELDSEHPQMTIESATLYDPNAEYPTSRVIKLGPSGDLVVESLDDNGAPYMPENHPLKKYVDKTAREQLGFSIFHFHSEDEREFWASLSDAEKKDILRVDKELLMENLRNLKRNHPNKGMHFGQLNHGDHNQGGEHCTCAYCGRNSRYIEDELAIAYNQHLDVIASYLENCMNARAELPYNLGNPRYQPVPLANNQLPPPIASYESDQEEANEQIAKSDEQAPATLAPPPVEGERQRASQSEVPQTTSITDDLAITSEVPSGEQPLMNLEPKEMLDILGKAKKVSELINPHTIQELVKYELLQRNIKPEAAIDESAKNLTEIFANIKKDDENGLAKAVEFIKCCSRLYKESNDQFSDVSQFLSNFADLIMKNDGKSFVDMLESLTDARNARIEEAKISQIPDGDNEEVAEKSLEPLKSPLNNHDIQAYEAQQDEEFRKEEYHQEEEYNEEFNEDYHHDHDHDHDHDYLCDHECVHGHECDHECHHDECDHGDEINDDDSASGYDEGDYDDEEAQRGRSQEIRGFVMIQAVNMIRAKFSEAYDRKVSEDRTQKFIAELEEEERAKKDREMKKLKAKELQKEKKRQQQLAKEEERKRKEEEDLAKKLEAQKKQEALRSEQLRKKEELRLKKEEEKRKRIEALQKKELEQQEMAQKKAQSELEAKKKAEALASKQKAESNKSKDKENLNASSAIKPATQSASKSSKARMGSKTESSISKPSVISAGNERSGNELQNDNSEDTEEYFQRQQQEILEKANRLTLDATDPLNELDGPEFNPQVTSTSPIKNHLLEQLYRAKPQSLSSTSSSTPQVTHPELQGFGVQDQSSNFISPSRIGDLNSQSDAFRGSDWRKHSNGFVQSSQPGVPGPTSSQFSPFANHATLDQLSQPPAVDLFSNAGLSSNIRSGMQQPNSSSLWANGATSRNNSIWNSAKPEAQHGIWGSNGSSQPGLQGSIHSMPNNRFSFSEQMPIADSEAIQKAAFDGFNLMQMNNQVVFGSAPALSLFQIVKGLSGHQTMGMADFLNSLKVPGKYQSDFIYDDFGSVSHIKVALASGLGGNPGSNPQMLQPSSQLPQGSLPGQEVPFGFPSATSQLGFQQNQQFQQPVSQQPPQPFKSINAAPSVISSEEAAHLKPNGLQLPGTIQGSLNPLAFGQGGSIW